MLNSRLLVFDLCSGNSPLWNRQCTNARDSSHPLRLSWESAAFWRRRTTSRTELPAAPETRCARPESLSLELQE